MNNIVNEDKKYNKKFLVKKDNNYFKNEPVEIKLNMKENIGYVMEENIENFSVEENYDIYKDLRKEDQIRIDTIKKMYSDTKNGKENNKEKEKDNNGKNENKENKKEEKQNKDRENIENKVNTKDINKPEEKEVKEDNKGDKNEIVEVKKKENEIKENKIEQPENQTKEKENQEVKPQNEITEKNEIKPENETALIKETKLKINQKEEDENEINTSTHPEKQLEKEKVQIINNGVDKEEEKIQTLPEYYKDLIKIKLEYGQAWIHKSRVEKIIHLEDKAKNKK